MVEIGSIVLTPKGPGRVFDVRGIVRGDWFWRKCDVRLNTGEVASFDDMILEDLMRRPDETKEDPAPAEDGEPNPWCLIKREGWQACSETIDLAMTAAIALLDNGIKVASPNNNGSVFHSASVADLCSATMLRMYEVLEKQHKRYGAFDTEPRTAVCARIRAFISESHPYFAGVW